jgi:membrane protease YdiL (CAAX protease family)
MARAMLRETLGDFWAYLRAPRLIAPVPLRQGWGTWAIMVGVYLAGLLLLGPVLAWWGDRHHLSAADAFKGISPLLLAPAVVLVFPLVEEAVFRGWLTGRPRALWLLAMGLVIGALLVPVTLGWHDQVASLGVLVAGLAALAGWFVLRRRANSPRWFAGAFGLWFYLSALVFGLSHMANYAHFGWALLPMVAPQLWAGLVFGYLRMRHGLLASALAHGLGNAAALAPALLAGLL